MFGMRSDSRHCAKGSVCLYIISGLVAGIALLDLRVRASDIHVPTDFPSIQAAIDAAIPGDVIHLGPGRYNERLTINKPLTLDGSGTNDCVLYCLTNVPIVSITGPGSCLLSNFEIEGGQYMGAEWYSGLADLGIVASNAVLTMDTVVMNQIKNYFVTVVDGSLHATNVSLWTRNVLAGCDVGFQLKGCTGSISNLRQDAGHLDHTININDPPAHHSDITIDNCTIRASGLDYGNCIRTYTDSNVRISHCYLYRNPSDAVPPFPAFNHNGVGINGYSNTLTIADNTFSNLPWAMYCVGSLGGNKVIVENNAILNSPVGGIIWDSMSYNGIDLGGGNLGSEGGNVFSQFPAPSTHFCGDILITNLNGSSSANIFALHNTWSNPTNRESVIYDKLDNPAFGRLITDDLVITSTGSDPAGKAVLTWNERGAGEKYTVQFRSDLASGIWTNTPGTWPITNKSLNDMRWTNSTANTATIFYRISSLVP
jgi:hypothetical protein